MASLLYLDHQVWLELTGKMEEGRGVTWQTLRAFGAIGTLWSRGEL